MRKISEETIRKAELLIKETYLKTIPDIISTSFKVLDYAEDGCIAHALVITKKETLDFLLVYEYDETKERSTINTYDYDIRFTNKFKIHINDLRKLDELQLATWIVNNLYAKQARKCEIGNISEDKYYMWQQWIVTFTDKTEHSFITQIGMHQNITPNEVKVYTITDNTKSFTDILLQNF